jgi:hypothetical protein
MNPNRLREVTVASIVIRFPYSLAHPWLLDHPLFGVIASINRFPNLSHPSDFEEEPASGADLRAYKSDFPLFHRR